MRDRLLSPRRPDDSEVERRLLHRPPPGARNETRKLPAEAAVTWTSRRSVPDSWGMITVSCTSTVRLLTVNDANVADLIERHRSRAARDLRNRRLRAGI